MSSFPDTFSLSAHVEQANINASLVLPAADTTLTPTPQYRITHVHGHFLVVGALAATAGFTLVLLDGASVILTYRMFLGAVAAGTETTLDLDGDWLTTPGNTCTWGVQTLVAPGGTTAQELVIQGTIV